MFSYFSWCATCKSSGQIRRFALEGSGHSKAVQYAHVLMFCCLPDALRARAPGRSIASLWKAAVILKRYNMRMCSCWVVFLMRYLQHLRADPSLRSGRQPSLRSSTIMSICWCLAVFPMRYVQKLPADSSLRSGRQPSFCSSAIMSICWCVVVFPMRSEGSAGRCC